ncbi:MAG TPA: acyl-CoA dehydrogenase family protein [Aeromicrobium sp.]|nr:acyl-CoA dehydrogenase family protein [Aeromicrobium sp.]HKY58086.1 acyl-CoA dehydrogenase family protein [Aeromicrobium sp.]
MGQYLSLTPEHEAFRRTVREFAEAEIAPYVAQWDRDHHFPVDLIHKMGDLGLFGLMAPEEYGGAGGDFTSLCLAIEEVGRVDQALGVTIDAAVGLGMGLLAEHGSTEQKDRWLPDLVAGRALAGFGLTEPGGGSDIRGLSTKAVLDGDEWVINGSKQFITNSGTDITSIVITAVRSGTSDSGRPEISAIIVPAGTPGFTVEPAYDKLGWHISDTHPLSYVDARVPADHLLGERGRGYAQFLAGLDDGRVAISALAVGCIQACLEMSVEYAGQRVAFGKPIGAKQGITFQISDIATMAHVGRAVTYDAAAMRDALTPESSKAEIAAYKQAAAMAKLYTTEAAVTATRIATQVFGGYGFMEEYPVARFYRDAKILEIGEGTSEVQRMLIARGLGLPVE